MGHGGVMIFFICTFVFSCFSLIFLILAGVFPLDAFKTLYDFAYIHAYIHTYIHTYIRLVWRTKDNGLRTARLEKAENHLETGLRVSLCKPASSSTLVSPDSLATGTG